MATNILTDQSLATEQTVYSSEIDNVSNIDIQAILSAGATGHVRYTLQRKTANGAWRNAVDEADIPLQFVTVGEQQDGINVIGINAAKLRVQIDILANATGTLNLEYEIV